MRTIVWDGRESVRIAGGFNPLFAQASAGALVPETVP